MTAASSALRAKADPIAGRGGKTGQFTIPTQPIRRRLRDLPQFVVTRGGEYFFAPGLRALALVGRPRHVKCEIWPSERSAARTIHRGGASTFKS